jgi:hypothetical protein
MAVCEVCGNDYDKSFEVLKGGKRHVFDSIECAAQRIAPTCDHCGCRILGHGIEADGVFFCCANCARLSGEKGARDRI